MSGSIFLYLDFIPGESTVFGFDSWIDIGSFSLGCTMEVDQEARTGSGGGTSGSGDPEDLSLDKKMDVATPVLLSCCATGAIIPRGKLMQINDVGKRVIVSEYAIGNSIITNVNLSASGSGIPEESLSINYGSITWRYYCYDHFRPDIQVVGGDIPGQPATQKDLENGIQRSWSLISSNPNEPDGATISAMAIGDKYNDDYPNPTDGSENLHPNSFWNIYSKTNNAPPPFTKIEQFRMPRPDEDDYDGT